MKQIKAVILELVFLGSNRSSTTCWLCDLRQVTLPLCAFIFISIKWE